MSPAPARPIPVRRRLWMSLIALGLLALVVHSVFGDHGYLALRRQRQEMQRLETEIQRLEEENRRLTQEIQELKSDPRAVERAAREQLKMARPGERVITLPQENPPPDSPTPQKKP